MRIIIVGDTGIKDAVIAAPFTDSQTPVLFVKKDEIPLNVYEEIDRLLPTEILVFGGTARVSDTIVRQLAVYAPTTRIAGPSVFATAIAASQTLHPVTEPPNGFDTVVNPDTPNLNTVLNRGTRIRFEPGIYPRFTYQPNEQHLWSDGAVLNGEDTTRTALSGEGKDVTVIGFEVTNYANPAQIGAITGMDDDWYVNPYQGPGGWQVEDCDVHHNAGAGVTLEYDDAAIRRCDIHHNRQIGFKLLYGTNQECTDSEVSFNNWEQDYDWGWEGGGSKCWKTTDLYVARVYSHDNHGPGLWTDKNNNNSVYEDCRVEDNYAAGIFHEISGPATIRNNQIRRNGFGHPGWLWGAGVQIANAGKATVHGNLIEGNRNGVCFTDQGRGPLSGEVYANTNLDTGITGVATNQASWPQGVFEYRGNTYQGGSFMWKGQTMGLTEWQQHHPQDGL